jgi:hypothetical protein
MQWFGVVVRVHAVIPGRRASGEPGIQTASPHRARTAAWIPGSRKCAPRDDNAELVTVLS